MKRILIGIGLLAASGLASATHAPASSSASLASMDVTGSITVSPEGFVSGYKLNRPEKLPPYVVQLLNRSIPRWRFKPNRRDGHPVIIKTRMSIRLVARPAPGHKYSIGIDQTNFGTPGTRDRQQVRFKGKVKPPLYPLEPRMDHVNGTVYVLARINRKGAVVKAAVEEVDLGMRAAPNLMTRWRRDFARATLKVVRHWTFSVPTEGKQASMKSWTVFIPVQYDFSYERHLDTYGKWRPYIPGPPQYIPWIQDGKLAAHARPPLGDQPQMLGAGMQRIDTPKS